MNRSILAALFFGLAFGFAHSAMADLDASSSGSDLAKPIQAQPNCLKSKDQIAKQNNSLYQIAKQKLKGSSSGLDKCFQLIQQHLDKCADEPQKLDNCSGLSPPADGGINQASDQMTKAYVKAANCYFAMSTCYARGASGDFPTSSVAQETSTCITNSTADSPDDKEVIKNYGLAYRDNIKNPQGSCWLDGGLDYESQAKSNLAGSGNSKTDGVLKGQAVDCIDTDIGGRLCEFHDSGGSHFGDGNSGVAGKDDASPAHLTGAGCSATVLGDGTTVVTAGHCAGANPGPQAITAVDSQGNSISETANCSQGITNSASYGADLAVCQLPTPISANPVYLATLDSNNSGSTCTTSGYVMSCGTGFFQNLTQQPVYMLSYPSQVSPIFQAGSQNLTWSSGTLFWNNQNNNMTTDLLGTGGSSGGGYVVDYNGQQVIVAANSYGSRFDTGLGAPAIPTGTFDDLQVQKVSTTKLADGGTIMQEMPF